MLAALPEEPEGLVDVDLRKAPEPTLPETDIAEPSTEHVLHDGEPLDQGEFLKNHAKSAAGTP